MQRLQLHVHHGAAAAAAAAGNASLQSLQLLLRLPCWQMLLPPQSLH
jgi:hypothetical protein